jgi:hypothetical protein
MRRDAKTGSAEASSFRILQPKKKAKIGRGLTTAHEHNAASWESNVTV